MNNMKKLLKSIDWRKFLRYEIYCFLIVTALYAGSLLNGRNTFPEHVSVIPIVMGLWGVMLMLSTISDYMLYKSRKNGKEIRDK